MPSGLKAPINQRRLIMAEIEESRLNWQQQASNFSQDRNLAHTAGVYVLDLISELGEVAKEILRATNYGEHETFETTSDLEGELGDVLYSLCMLATTLNVDLDEALSATLHKYEVRWQEKGHMGSQQQ